MGAMALVAATAVAVRLVDASVLEHDRWVEVAERQQSRTVELSGERGSLLDRRGRPLAVSVPAWSAWADPTAFADPSERRRAARRLAGVLSLEPREVEQRLARDGYFAWLERKLDPETRDAVAALGLDGIGFVRESRREHPHRAMAGPLLGAVGMDEVGLEGLEYHLESTVAGRPGLLLTMRDARGGGFLPEGVSFQPPTRGADVVLTLDAVVQHVAERELRRAVARTGATAGSIVVILPASGEVAALANHPTFNPSNLPTHPSHLRTNRAVASCYEPGSTLKMFTVAAALEAGLVEPTTVIDCGGGSVRVGRTRIRDHRPFDDLTVTEVIANSSNVGAVRIGQLAGPRRLHATLTAFGFGQRTGIEYPTESPGILREPARWSDLSVASISFGQEVAVTPLQLTAAVAALANGGVWNAPRLVREVRHADGRIETAPRPRPRRVVSPATARRLALMLAEVVESGTGRAAAVAGHRVAGKTGTAQKIGPDGSYLGDRYVASFVGWAPADQPEFVALIVLDEPRSPSSGGLAAAPVFAELARDVLRYLQVPPGQLPGHRLSTSGGVDAS